MVEFPLILEVFLIENVEIEDLLQLYFQKLAYSLAMRLSASDDCKYYFQTDGTIVLAKLEIAFLGKHYD